MQRWRERLTTWNWLIAALGTALYALRVSVELASPGWLWGLATASLCLGLGYWVHYRTAAVSLTPLWVLWLYVVWPWYAPSLALAVGWVGIVALLVRNLGGGTGTPALLDGAVFAAALALYVSTLAPTVLPADSGEFQIVGPLLGVAHPPGYALFTMLAKVFSLFPVGEIAWRVNLMGAVSGALTLTIVGRTARRLSGSPWAGLVAAGVLGVSTTFWAQSTTINIRALTILFTALCCYYLLEFLDLSPSSERSARALTGLAASYGLAIAHHAWPAFLAPVFGATILWHDPGLIRRVRRWPRYLLAFALPFLGDLYIVARAISGAPFGTDSLVNARRVIDHLLGVGFGGDMFAFLHWDRMLWERTLVVGNILRFQFGVPLLCIAALGFAWLAWRRPKVAALLGGVFALMAFIVATYRAPQSVEYLMPAYVPVALCIGCAVGAVHRPRDGIASPARALLVGLALLPVLSLGRDHLPSYVALHRDRSARQYAESVLLDAPPNARILSNWHWYTPLRYLQLVEGQRPDVEVTYLFPQGATEMPQAWPQRIVQELTSSDRPLIVTNYYPTYRDLPYRIQPQGEAFRVYEGPSFEVPAWLNGMDVAFSESGEPRIRILGYRIHCSSDLHPGDWVSMDLAWQPLAALGHGYSFFVHLVGAEGIPLGQQDQRHDAAPAYQPGEVLVDRYEFPVFATAPPGEYQLIAGVYRTFEDGSWSRLTTDAGGSQVGLGTVQVAFVPLPPVTRRPLYRPFVDGPTLVGVDYDDAFPEQRRVYLHWLAGERPAQARLVEGGQQLAQATVPGSDRPGYVTTALDVPAGAAALELTLVGAEDKQALAHRTTWGSTRAAPLPLPDPAARPYYLPLGGKMALIGVDLDAPWAAGEEARVALRFLGLQPIVDDYVVSVGLRGEGIAASQSDSVPATGAIPTFKWVRGSQVVDAHWLRLPADAQGEVALSLGVYDAFTARALPPLDERIARQGRAGVLLQQIHFP